MSKQLLNGTTRRSRGAARRLPAARSKPLCRRAAVCVLIFLMLVRGAGLPLPAGASGTGGKPAGVPQIAVTFNVYGPRRFERGAGAPSTVAESFVLPADAVAPFRVQLQNGGADGSGRVSSATVKLNGADLFRQSDFSQQVASLAREVTLGARNTVEVKKTRRAAASRGSLTRPTESSRRRRPRARSLTLTTVPTNSSR